MIKFGNYFDYIYGKWVLVMVSITTYHFAPWGEWMLKVATYLIHDYASVVRTENIGKGLFYVSFYYYSIISFHL